MKAVLGWFALIMVVVVVMVGLAWISIDAQNRRERSAGFKGACKLLEGEVHDDLCVKDGTVVLTLSEFDEK